MHVNQEKFYHALIQVKFKEKMMLVELLEAIRHLMSKRLIVQIMLQLKVNDVLEELLEVFLIITAQYLNVAIMEMFKVKKK